MYGCVCVCVWEIEREKTVSAFRHAKQGNPLRHNHGMKITILTYTYFWSVQAIFEKFSQTIEFSNGKNIDNTMTQFFEKFINTHFFLFCSLFHWKTFFCAERVFFPKLKLNGSRAINLLHSWLPLIILCMNNLTINLSLKAHLVSSGLLDWAKYKIDCKFIYCRLPSHVKHLVPVDI